jgi:hypothetical protein
VTIVELAGESTLQEETNMIELVTGVVDYGDAPEIFLTGLARVSRISADLVRMSWYVERETHDGIERRMALHCLRQIDAVTFDSEALYRGVQQVRAERPLFRIVGAGAH